MPYALCTRTFKIVRVCLAKVNVEKIRWTFTLHIFFFVALAIFSFLKRISTLWHRRHCALKFLSDNLFLHNSPLLWRNDENWFYFFFALKSIICITFFSVLRFVLWKLFLRKSLNILNPSKILIHAELGVFEKFAWLTVSCLASLWSQFFTLICVSHQIRWAGGFAYSRYCLCFVVIFWQSFSEFYATKIDNKT